MASTLRPTPSPEDVDRRGIGADVGVDEAGCRRLDGRSLGGSSAVVDLKEAGLSQSTKALHDDAPPIAMKQPSRANDTRRKTPEDSSTSSSLPTFAVALPMEPQVACSQNDKQKTVCKPVQDSQEDVGGDGSVMGGEITHLGVPRGQKRSRSPLATPCKQTEPVLSHAMERYLASIDPDEFEAYRNRETSGKDSKGQPTDMVAIESTIQEGEQSELAPVDTTPEEEQTVLRQEISNPARHPSTTLDAADELRPPPAVEETEQEGIITIAEGPLEVGTDRSASDSAIEDVEPTPAELHQRLQVDAARMSPVLPPLTYCRRLARQNREANAIRMHREQKIPRGRVAKKMRMRTRPER
ncbi:hypothetical protein CSOJ01_10604 [Colletotrichum sojae]|uniref:Uncharacterized protein n=1 Tax=Colletotrichum sojae TaxID=2175907 RepID=A0A8H6IZZ3_9PEZI|nr:hypothetical protein CSOJ01_10604 [Colletotrichum sojae]